MTDSFEADSSRNPPWLTAGRGIGPQMTWRFHPETPLTGMALARETGEVFASDRSGTIYRLNRKGEIAGINHFPQPLFHLRWADDGSSGVAIEGEETVIRLDRNLQVAQRLKTPDVCTSVAIAPYGNHIAVALADGSNRIYNERKRRLTQFGTIRPLSYLSFCTSAPRIYGAAENGLLCCHNLSGAELWQQKNWSNVGQLRTTGDGDLVYLASFAQGVQTIDGDGTLVGSYVLDGTVNRLAVSFEPERLCVATIERSLYWLDADGELLWGSVVDDEIADIACDPLGEWAIIGLAEKGICFLDWAGSR